MIFQIHPDIVRHGRLMQRAKREVHLAVRAGELVRAPCVRCSSTKNVVGHHEDYSRPLDVMWLCRKCHRNRHDEINLERCGYARPNMPKRYNQPSVMRAVASAVRVG